MRRFWVIAIPIVTLSFFVLIMLSDNFLKKPFGKDDDIPQSIQLVKQDIMKEKWDEANKKTDELSKTWKKVVARVQFSAEKGEIDSFDVCIARLKGALTVKDKVNALLELSEAYEHWKNIGR